MESYWKTIFPLLVVICMLLESSSAADSTLTSETTEADTTATEYQSTPRMITSDVSSTVKSTSLQVGFIDNTDTTTTPMPETSTTVTTTTTVTAMPKTGITATTTTLTAMPEASIIATPTPETSTTATSTPETSTTATSTPETGSKTTPTPETGSSTTPTPETSTTATPATATQETTATHTATPAITVSASSPTSSTMEPPTSASTEIPGTSSSTATITKGTSSTQHEGISTTSATIYSPTTASSGSLTTPVIPSLKVVISESNLLLANPENYFVQIQVSPHVDINSVWLVIRNASVDASEKPLVKDTITTSMFEKGLYVLKVNNTELGNLESVLIALYADEDTADNLTTHGLYDCLLYSSSGNIHPNLKKLFSTLVHQDLIIDYKKLKSPVPVSLSRCSEAEVANTAVVLTSSSANGSNFCNLTISRLLEMKLTKSDHPCSPTSPNNFQNSLANYVISDVNAKEQCGLAFHMLKDMNVTPVCINEGKELDVRFTVMSAFPDQVSLIVSGYKSFLLHATLDIGGETYSLQNCYADCFNRTTPPTDTDDNRIRVTIAVVVSCIGVFLLVLMFVVLYLRRKRKGIHQFHMTRLDEDEDLAGDMDDFVGNQGPTFSNFR